MINKNLMEDALRLTWLPNELVAEEDVAEEAEATVVVEVEVEATEVVVAVVVTKVEEEAMEEEEEAVSVGNLFPKQCFAPDCLVVCSLDVLRVFIRIPSFA
ncbi:hypothetical protein CCMSSC00406_0010280 [Pleurotus cornucopiae]|uniref:Uncharacterized protein n=1 Tax=Pleurotus cornucopiae TaxID=5321 RepID=A0ACB7II90_PLECO|nr:hypothetical protein CCMSSC00406_0010280 [Pleurotus cornucopiae]